MNNLQTFDEFVNESILDKTVRDYKLLSHELEMHRGNTYTWREQLKAKEKLIQLAKKPEFRQELIKLLPDADFLKESYDNVENYMFFNNLETLKRKIEFILSKDFTAIDGILKNGHDWAESHIAAASENVNQVADFLANELKETY